MIKDILMTFVRVLILFGFIYLVYLMGFKGIISFIGGMFIMAYLLLSNNPLLSYFIDLFTKQNKKVLLNELKNRNGNEKRK
jgi:hypothetical protein